MAGTALKTKPWGYLFLAFAVFVPFSGLSLTESNQSHIDIDAGVRFTAPFPIYQKKTSGQVANLIQDAVPGDMTKGLDYSSGLYADDSEAFIVVWRQKIAELPSRYQFHRLKYLASLRSTAAVSDLEVIEARAAATFTLEPKGMYKARVAMLLTKEENVFIGYYDRKPIAEGKFQAMVASIEVDPKRQVQWKDLDSGFKPIWTGLIIAVGFILGFLCYILIVSIRAKGRGLPIKKPGDFTSPDHFKDESDQIPDGI